MPIRGRDRRDTAQSQTHKYQRAPQYRWPASFSLPTLGSRQPSCSRLSIREHACQKRQILMSSLSSIHVSLNRILWRVQFPVSQELPRYSQAELPIIPMRPLSGFNGMPFKSATIWSISKPATLSSFSMLAGLKCWVQL